MSNKSAAELAQELTLLRKQYDQIDRQRKSDYAETQKVR